MQKPTGGRHDPSTSHATCVERKWLRHAALATCLVGLTSALPTQAGIVVNFYEDSGIQAEYAGYLTIPEGASSITIGVSKGLRMNPGYPAFTISTIAQLAETTTDPNAAAERYTFFTSSPSDFGTGSFSNLGSTATGDLLVIDRSSIYLPRDYASGTFISGNASASNASLSLADVGATPGSYLWYYGDLVNGDPVDGQFLRLNVVAGSTRPALPTAGGNSNNVPAPTTPLLIAAGLLGGGLSRRLNRRT